MEWWREMFAVPLWQRLQLGWEEADDADTDADHVVRALGLTEPTRVLDVPCGTGRIASRLRTLGHEVVGIDTTDRFVESARDAGVPVIRADMRTQIVRAGTFEAAVCLWGSFGYFDEEDNGMQARALIDAVRPGGRCLIDTLVADTLLPRFVADAAWSVGDIDVTESRRYDPKAKRIETTWSFASGDEHATQVTSVRLYTLDELTDLLAARGCTTFQAFDGELEPFGEASERLWLVATKG
ncbi:MAG TPA: class I SAM-dependent methyltransferase [Actinomycetota bacterium]|nr:class I SAM-dependent methyltransferase [Actinomycetota bacterium]